MAPFTRPIPPWCTRAKGESRVGELFPSADSSQVKRGTRNGKLDLRGFELPSLIERRASYVGVYPPGRVPPAEQRARVAGAVSRPTLIWTLNRAEGTKLPLGSRTPHPGVQWPPAPRTEMASQEPGNCGSSGSAESPPRDFRSIRARGYLNPVRGDLRRVVTHIA